MHLQSFFDNFRQLVDAPTNIPKLRKLILHLAFRGKLVPQCSDEGFASSLLKRIELVRRAQRKNEEAQELPPINMEEKQHELPAAWEWVRLGDVVEYDCALKVSPDQIAADSWLLELEDIEKDSSRIIQRFTFADRQSKSSKAKFVAGDVLYGKLRPYLNKVIVADDDGYCTTEIVALRGYLEIEPRILMYALKRPEFVAYVNEKSYGVKMPRLGSDDARLSVIPLPPFEEQKRIVQKIDELFGLCDELEAAQQAKQKSGARLNGAILAPLNKAASLTPDEFEQASTRLGDNFDTLCQSIQTLSNLRSTILKLAVQGRLVAQDPNDEPASVLFQQIRQEQKRLLNEGKIKSINLSAIDLSQAPFDLPAGWMWVRFPELGEFSRGRSKHRPRNAPELYVGGQYKFVQTGDVARANGTITTFTALYNECGLAHSRMWPAGTMCITIAANIADSGILGFDACFPDSVVGFVPSSIIGGAQYFEYFMRTAKSHLQDFAPSTAQKNINISILQEVLIPLPPLAEQKRIVVKVNQLMSLCDELEAKLRQAEADSEKLMNAAVKHVLDSVRDTSKTAEEVFA